MAVLETSSKLSDTKVNLDNRDFFLDLCSEMFDGDDVDDMLDRWFDKVTMDGDHLSTQQRSGRTKKCKEKDIWKTK